MKRISTPTAVQHKFVDGNKDTGLKPTQFSAEWCNMVQEEISKLIEAAGQTVGGSDDQLAKIFTALYILEATLKSVALQKSFTGGYSRTEISGENLKMFAEGDAVTDDSSFELSRLLLHFVKSVTGGKTACEIDPLGVHFKSGSGDTLGEHATIVYDPSTGRITISCAEGIVCSGKIYATSDVEGDVCSDNVNPTNASHAVNIGSATGGVGLAGPVIVSDKLKLNLIESYQAANPIEIKSIVKAVNLPNDFVDVSDLDLTDTDVLHGLLAENLWTVGQVKRFLNNTSSAKTMSIYIDTSGTFKNNISIPSNSYVTFVCTGFYSTPYRSNHKYAVFVQGI